MVIQLEGCEWRINGDSLQWAIEYPRMKKGESVWDGRYFYSTLEYAVEKAYELALRESPATAVDMKSALAECKRVKTALVNAVVKAVAHEHVERAGR